MICLPMVFTYNMPNFLKSSTDELTANPKKAFYNLECFLSNYFDSVFYVKTLLEMILPYLYSLILVLIWMKFYRKTKKSQSKFVGFLTVLFICCQSS